MAVFVGHKIIEGQDGCTVVLFLDGQLNEFAKELGENQIEVTRSLEKAIQDYIKDRFSGIKIKTINVMLGSLLIASLQLGGTAYATGFVTNQAQVQTLGIYWAKSQDTLYKIAGIFNTTVSQLKSINNLAGDIIYAGQKLKVPKILTSEIANKLPYGVFKVGASGEEVRRIQNALSALGYSIAEDGIYGGATRAAVLDFQNQYEGLSKDGVFGSMTRKYLYQELLTDNQIVKNPGELLVLVNKNYSLPVDYVPDNLVVPNIPFPFEGFDPKKLMRQDAASSVQKLFAKAKLDNINIYGASGYRSYERQEAIFASNVSKYGLQDANQYSAKPGESEHQTGLALDVTSPSVSFNLTQSFGDTREGRWLKENAPQFGFIMRYPKGKENITGYQYEPWHIRYVGMDAATSIINSNITLEEYLGKK